jgi:hypothetical protein
VANPSSIGNANYKNHKSNQENIDRSSDLTKYAKLIQEIQHANRNELKFSTKIRAALFNEPNLYDGV